MSRALTATGSGLAAAMVVAGVTAASPAGALPVFAVPTDESPAAPRVTLDLPLFETAADPAATGGEPFATPAIQPGPETAYLPAVTTLAAWPPEDFSPGDFPGGNLTGREASPLFALPVNALLALPDSRRIALREPGLLALLGSGLLGVALLARRRGRSPSNQPREGDPE